MLLYCHNFKAVKSKYAFSYLTRSAHTAFLQRIDKENKENRLKQMSLEALALSAELDEHLTHLPDRQKRVAMLNMLTTSSPNDGGMDGLY